MDIKKVDKVNKLEVEKEIMNCWNEILGSVTFCSSQRHRMIKQTHIMCRQTYTRKIICENNKWQVILFFSCLQKSPCEIFYLSLLGFLFKTEEAVRSVAFPAKKTKRADLILGCFSLTTAFLNIAYSIIKMGFRK